MLTGLGVVAANGLDAPAFWSSLCAGRSGLSRIDRFDASKHRMSIAGEVKDFDPARIPSRNVKVRRVARQTQFALAASLEALRDAGLTEESLVEAPQPTLLSVGTSTTAFEMIERAKEELDQRGPARVNPLLISYSQPNATATILMEYFAAPCQSLTFSSACTAGFDAVRAAFEHIRSGKCDLAIAGGTDAGVTSLAMAGFWSAGLLPDWQGEASQACRPFDRDRRGGVLAEGAAFVVLESASHALARGAQPYASLLGFGSSIDRPKTDPGAAFGDAMSSALSESCCLPQDLDCVLAHGPGDLIIDHLETEALRNQLGAHAYRIPVISIKGSTGNPLSAAGPLQLAACALAMRHSMIPPTVNHEHGDLHCDLDYNPGRTRSASIHRAMIDLHGMGGRNICALVQRYP